MRHNLGMPPKNLPDVNRLRVLHEVAARGSITSAAKAMGVSGSAVSQQIALLEREAGVPLLDRGPRGIALTGAGHDLVEWAEKILHVLEQTQTAMDRLNGAVAGRIQLASIASAGAAIVLPASGRLAVKHPEIALTVTIAEPSRSLDWVIRGTMDLAIIDTYRHVPVPFPDYLSVTRIHHEPLALVTEAGRQFDRPVRLTDFAKERWVLPPEDAACGQAVRYACRAQGFEPNVQWETDDLLLLAHAASAGQGVTLLPRMAIAGNVAPVAVHAVAGTPLTREVLTVTRSFSSSRPIVRAVLAELAPRGGPPRTPRNKSG